MTETSVPDACAQENSQSWTFAAGAHALFVRVVGDNSKITQEQIELMLEAARWAPTHKRTEPWHFVHLSGKSKTQFEVGFLRSHIKHGGTTRDEVQ